MHSLAWVSTCSMSGSEDVKARKASVVHSPGLHSRGLHSRGLMENQSPQWGAHDPVGQCSSGACWPEAGAPALQTQRPLCEEEWELTGRGESMCRGPELREVGAGCRMGCVPGASEKTGVAGGRELGKTLLLGSPSFFSLCFLLLLSPLIPVGWVHFPKQAPSSSCTLHRRQPRAQQTHPSRPFSGRPPPDP